MEVDIKSELSIPSAEELQLKKYAWQLMVIWTVATVLSLSLNLYERYKNTQEIALTEARTQFNRDLAFRSWVGAEGGIYAAVNESTQPSRYLKEHAERDVTIPSGKALTLINPEYMIRLVNADFPELHGAPTRVTSLNPRRLLNAPDNWEERALKAFHRGKREVYEFATFGGKPHLRFMKPLFAEQPCIDCHPDHSYKLGDIMGGMSIVLPMSSLLEISRSQAFMMIVGHTLLWVLGIVGISRGQKQLLDNIKRRIQAEMVIKRQAYHDALTGLPNRRLLLELLDHQYAQSLRHNHSGALLFLDLDNFKPVNDTLGHDVGDELLQEVARRLEDNLRKEDIAVRLGGDEFVVLLSEIDGVEASIKEQTLKAAEKLRQALEVPYVIKAHTLSVPASIGAIIFPQEGVEPEQMLKLADIAMYSAKEEGRAKVCLFDPKGRAEEKSTKYN